MSEYYCQFLVCDRLADETMVSGNRLCEYHRKELVRLGFIGDENISKQEAEQ